MTSLQTINLIGKKVGIFPYNGPRTIIHTRSKLFSYKHNAECYPKRTQNEIIYKR